MNFVKRFVLKILNHKEEESVGKDGCGLMLLLCQRHQSSALSKAFDFDRNKIAFLIGPESKVVPTAKLGRVLDSISAELDDVWLD